MKQQKMNRDWIATARTLNEALPYMQRYTGAVVVVKFGGNAMGDDDAMAEFARDIVLMRQVGVNPVVVRLIEDQQLQHVPLHEFLLRIRAQVLWCWPERNR